MKKQLLTALCASALLSPLGAQAMLARKAPEFLRVAKVIPSMQMRWTGTQAAPTDDVQQKLSELDRYRKTASWVPGLTLSRRTGMGGWSATRHFNLVNNEIDWLLDARRSGDLRESFYGDSDQKRLTRSVLESWPHFPFSKKYKELTLYRLRHLRDTGELD